MNNPLTPVEVLDSEIEKFRALCATVSRLDRQDTLYLAALELAKADAEYQAAHSRRDGLGNSIAISYGEHRRMEAYMTEARTNLYKALNL